MAEGEPGLLASGSYDGDIVVWNTDRERATCKLNASCRGSREGQQGRWVWQGGVAKHRG